jgi:hypothetical protein
VIDLACSLALFGLLVIERSLPIMARMIGFGS